MLPRAGAHSYVSRLYELEAKGYSIVSHGWLSALPVSAIPKKTKTVIVTNNPKNSIKIAPSGLMDLENVALYLGVDLGTIRWMRRMKKLPFVKLGGRLYVKQQDIDAYVDVMTEPVC